MGTPAAERGIEGFKKRFATLFLSLGRMPYKALTRWSNTTLGYDIGEYTYGAPRVVFPDGKLRIGKFCSIAWNVTIYLGGNHRVDWFATFPFPSRPDRFPSAQGIDGFLDTRGDVTIGNDVWIGSDVIILSGVTIGDGAVIGAGSVVAADVEPYTIVAGNPARVVKKRFSDDVIVRLAEIKWWDWPCDKIDRNLRALCSGDSEKLDELVE